MDPGLSQAFYRQRYWQALALPLIVPALAYSMLGFFAGWQWARDNWWPAVVWLTYPLVVSLWQWLAKTLFFTQLLHVEPVAEEITKLETALQPLTKLHYPLRVRLIEIGAVPLLEVPAVVPPTVYISRATLHQLSAHSLRLLFTQARARVKERRQFMNHRGFEFNFHVWVVIILFYMLLMRNGTEPTGFQVGMILGTSPLVLGAILWHTVWSRPLFEIMLADKEIWWFARRNDQPQLNDQMMETILAMEYPTEKHGKRPRLNVRLRIYSGEKPNEIAARIKRYEDEKGIGVEPEIHPDLSAN